MPSFAPGSFCWADLVPGDQARALAFYGELAGWTSSVGGEEYGGYALAFAGEQDPGNTTAGFNPAVPGFAPGWNVYLATDDMDATLAKAVELGGTVTLPRMDIPGMGAAGMATDPAGVQIGFWQPGGHSGFGVFGEPGGFCWAEAYSTDAKATTTFLAELFGLETAALAETDEFTYYQLKVPGQEAPVFGVMQQAPGEPSRTSAYVFIDGVDAVAERMTAHGATITRAAADTPFGRLVILTDSEGAEIKIIDPPLARDL